MKSLHWVAMILVVIGGINWGLVGAMNVDVVSHLFGLMTPVTRAIYCLVGVSAIYILLTSLKK